MPLRVLAVVALPDPVMELFTNSVEVIEGTLADSAEVQPDILLCSIGMPGVNAASIAALPDSVKAIATYSVGYDHIDVAAARARGIAIYNTPGVLGEAVADAAMLLMLGASRRVTEAIALIRSGAWRGWTPGQLLGFELAGKTLGILGLGDIGLRVARRAQAFGMNITYHNRRPLEYRADIRFESDPHALIAESDVLLLAWPSTDVTRRFINAHTLALAKSTMVLVNIGRGDLVDDYALIDALSRGTIQAAGLDVFDNEPDIDPRYRDLRNAFILPHIGSSTWEARLAMARTLIDAFEIALAGGTPPNCVC